jgi:small subunit ribosomal protein S8
MLQGVSLAGDDTGGKKGKLVVNPAHARRGGVNRRNEMSRTDLIADAFTMIRNAIMARKDNLDVPASGTIKDILEILKKENYIDNFKHIEDKKQGVFRVYLKYVAGKSAIRNIRRVSKPGLRIYVKHDKIPSVLRGRGLAIISTSKGIMPDKQAKEHKIGGEVIGYIW